MTLPATVAELGKVFPGTPVGMVLDPRTAEAAAVSWLYTHGQFRCLVILGDDNIQEQLRSSLCSPDALKDGFVEWAEKRWGNLGFARPVLRVLISQPLTGLTTSQAVEAIASASAAERYLTRAGLPTLKKLARLCNALHVATRLQRDPARTLGSIAREVGYSSHGAVSHLFRREFDLEAKDIRRSIGWEWLAERSAAAKSTSKSPR